MILQLIFNGLQVVFVGFLLIFFISWCHRKIVPVIGSWLSLHIKDEPKDEDNSQREMEHKIKEDVWKQNIQKKFKEKAAKYKENILIPREQEKRERKEKEYYKHFGQVWSGTGIALGGDEETCDQSNATDNERAARRRKIPESEVVHTKVVKKEIKPKRVIELPEEPKESDPAALLIIVRTPISTTLRRRFHRDHKFQNVLDFMTKSGFSECLYQMCTSFPRVILTDPEVSLSELGFQRRTILNIEEKINDL